MARAFVLAAGLGTRLRPLTEEVPKSLVPVCGVPLLAYALATCAKHGLRDVVVNAHWLAEQVSAWEGEREGVRVTVSVEQPLVLGTGGGLKHAAHLLDDRFVVLNADVIHDVDLGTLLGATPPGGAVMALRRDAVRAERYGVVAADDTGTVVRLATVASAPARGTVPTDTFFMGIHALDRATLDLVPGGAADIVRTAYEMLVPERKVRAIVDGGPWLDTGDLATYLEANLAILRRTVVTALDPHPRAAFARDGAGRETGDARIVSGAAAGAVWVAPEARVDGRIEEAVIGRGARVPSGADLRRVVVWDGVEVPPGAHRDAVFTPAGSVSLPAT